MNNQNTDQPAHLRSLVSAFVVRCIDSIIPLLAKPKISGPYLISVAEQAGSSLIWLQAPKTDLFVTWLSSWSLPFYVYFAFSFSFFDLGFAARQGYFTYSELSQS